MPAKKEKENKLRAGDMSDLLAKMNRSALDIPVQPAEDVPQNALTEQEPLPKPATPAKSTKSANGGDRLLCETYDKYKEIYLVKNPSIPKNDGILRVALNKDLGYDLRFISSCAGIAMQDLVNNIVREHLKAHYQIIKKMCRPALSWTNRKEIADE